MVDRYNGAAMCITKQKDDEWLCMHCGIYYSPTDERIDRMYRFQGYRIVESSCEKCFDGENMVRIGGCVKCDKPANTLFSVYVDVVGETRELIIMNCSKECMKASCKLYRKELDALTTCSYCGNMEEKMPKCGGCGKNYYCSKVCQKKDWPIHKDECKKVREFLGSH
jgi:hypothetical protein